MNIQNEFQKAIYDIKKINSDLLKILLMRQLRLLKVSHETNETVSQSHKVSQWSKLGISRATYYRRKKGGLL